MLRQSKSGRALKAGLIATAIVGVAGLAVIASVGPGPAIASTSAARLAAASVASAMPTPAPALAVTAPVMAAAAQIALGGECILSISKDACDGFFGDGAASISFCTTTNCQTLNVRGAVFKAEFRSSNLRCADSPISPTLGRCDEAGERRDGTLKVETDFILRIQQPCRFRGWLNGRGTFFAIDGARFDGEIRGAIGVGADREPRCVTLPSPGPVPISCETCLDVSFDGSQDPGIWRVGVEWVFEGKRADLPTGETVRLNISGDLRARGTFEEGPLDPNSFRFRGAADGINTVPCR